MRILHVMILSKRKDKAALYRINRHSFSADHLLIAHMFMYA